MRNVKANETFTDPAFPTLGIDLTRPFLVQRDGTTVEGENVRAFEPDSQRGRGGSRPGLSRFILDALPGEIQSLTLTVSSSGTALWAEYDDVPPDFFDPSSPGNFQAWPPGRFTRTPYLPIPEGGWGVQPNKTATEMVAITWARPTAITSGTALSATQLNAVARDHTTGDVVAGSFAYNPASGTVLAVGEDQALATTFTPTDTERYRSTPASNLITVVQAGSSTTAVLIYVGTFATGTGVVAVEDVSINGFPYISMNIGDDTVGNNRFGEAFVSDSSATSQARGLLASYLPADQIAASSVGTFASISLHLSDLVIPGDNTMESGGTIAGITASTTYVVVLVLEKSGSTWSVRDVVTNTSFSSGTSGAFGPITFTMPSL